MPKQELLKSINRILSGLNVHCLRKVYYFLLGFTGNTLKEGGEPNGE